MAARPASTTRSSKPFCVQPPPVCSSPRRPAIAARAVAVAHVSPWLTTVAASTHSRSLAGNVTLGNGAEYTGASMNTDGVERLADRACRRHGSARRHQSELVLLQPGVAGSGQGGRQGGGLHARRSTPGSTRAWRC